MESGVHEKRLSANVIGNPSGLQSAPPYDRSRASDGRVRLSGPSSERRRGPWGRPLPDVASPAVIVPVAESGTGRADSTPAPTRSRGWQKQVLESHVAQKIRWN